MPIEFINFGDTFRHNEREYVFLAKTPEAIYAAEILDTSKTREIEDLYQKISRGKESSVGKRVLFCYVVLETEDFRGRMAHLGRSQQEGDLLFAPMRPLEQVDIEEIEKEILSPNSAAPLGLKKIIQQKSPDIERGEHLE